MTLAAMFLFGVSTGLVLVEWAEQHEFKRRHRRPTSRLKRHN